jgi:hypothetical protein
MMRLKGDKVECAQNLAATLVKRRDRCCSSRAAIAIRHRRVMALFHPFDDPKIAHSAIAKYL